MRRRRTLFVMKHCKKPVKNREETKFSELKWNTMRKRRACKQCPELKSIHYRCAQKWKDARVLAT
jgi:hypothetical protein